MSQSVLSRLSGAKAGLYPKEPKPSRRVRSSHFRRETSTLPSPTDVTKDERMPRLKGKTNHHADSIDTNGVFESLQSQLGKYRNMLSRKQYLFRMDEKRRNKTAKNEIVTIVLQCY